MEAATAQTVGAPTQRRRSRGIPERRLAKLMVAPSMILIAVVAAYPIIYAIWLSLHEYSVRQAGLSRWAGSLGLRNYQTALQSVTYTNTSDNPSGTKTVSFVVTDDAAGTSNIATRTISFTGVNDAPVVTATGGATLYAENAAPVAVDSGVTVKISVCRSAAHHSEDCSAVW